MEDVSPSPDIDALIAVVEPILRAEPAAITEHELLRALARAGLTEFDTRLFDSSLDLFRAHFLLFHTLYRLRAKLQQTGLDLSIHCLRIEIRPCKNRPNEVPAEYDPMQGYYEKLDNLFSTGREDVEELLGSFWTLLARRQDREQALQTLGMDASADVTAIKRRYHELAFEHHPDRGGDASRLQEINAAMDALGKSGPHGDDPG